MLQLSSDPICADCHGTGSDIGSDGTDGDRMRDGKSVLACRSCKGSGENPRFKRSLAAKGGWAARRMGQTHAAGPA